MAVIAPLQHTHFKNLSFYRYLPQRANNTRTPLRLDHPHPAFTYYSSMQVGQIFGVLLPIRRQCGKPAGTLRRVLPRVPRGIRSAPRDSAEMSTTCGSTVLPRPSFIRTTCRTHSEKTRASQTRGCWWREGGRLCSSQASVKCYHHQLMLARTLRLQ